MKSKIIYKRRTDSLTIEIKPNWKSIIGIGYLAMALPFFVFLVIGMYVVLDDLGMIFRFDQKSFLFLGLMIVSAYLLVIILKKVFQSEIAVVDKSKLVLGKKLFFKTDEITFRKDEIQDLRFEVTENFTNHDLSPQGFDYLGFNTEEKQVQDLISDGKIAFFWKGGIFRFGKDIHADQGEEIIERIENWH